VKTLVYLLNVLFVFFCVGCKMGKKWNSKREIYMPNHWHSAVGNTNTVLAQWWLQFNNPKLDALVQEGLANNLDIQIAAKRLELAQVQAQMVDFSSRPNFNASVNGEKRRSNYIGLPFGGGGVIKSRTENFASNLTVNWEVDLWGRIRHAKNASSLDVYAVDLDNKAASHSLVSQIVKGWFSLGEANELFKLMERQIGIAKLAQDQIEIRYKLGNATSADLKRAQANYVYYQSRLSQISASIVRYSRALELMLGRHAGNKAPEVPDLPDSLAEVPVGLPSGVLSRRPDIAASITRIKAAELRMTEGRVGLLPKLSLTGSAGASSNQLKDLLDGNFLIWALGSGITQTVLLPDERKSRVREREVKAEKYLLEHRSIVLSALTEVEQALQIGLLLDRQLGDSLETANKYGELIDISNQRYAQGVGSLRDLLEAQRLYVDSRMNWVRLKKQQIDNRVNLHLALGGGFGSKETSNEASTAD